MAETLQFISDAETHDANLGDATKRVVLRTVIPFGEAMGVKIEGDYVSSPISSQHEMTVTGGDADGKNKNFDDAEKD